MAELKPNATKIDKFTDRSWCRWGLVDFYWLVWFILWFVITNSIALVINNSWKLINNIVAISKIRSYDDIK
jgi:hypothetical protein